MRAVAAILFSALLLITQAMAALTPVHLTAAPTCCGCNCAQRACCATRPVTPGQPAQPLAMERRAAPDQQPANAPLVAALRPPSSEYKISFLPPAAPQATALPLFRWHCALLL